MANTEMTDKKRMLIFINLLLTCIASSLLQTALNTAMQPIADSFGITTSTAQWLTSAYSLAMAIMMPLTAFLITRFRTKPLYITAISCFLTGLGICIFAPSFEILMIGRIFQACSNGITTSMAQVVLLSIYPPERKGTIMGWYGLSIGAAPVIAPTIGGILSDTVGWRMIFVLAFVIMAISLVYALFVFDNVLETQIKKFDIVSFILSAFAFGGITLGIGNITSGGISTPMTYIPLVCGIIGAAGFICRQLHLTQPFLELRVFRSAQFTWSVVGSMLLYLVMMGGSVILPLYVQGIMKRSATISGLVTLPGSLAMTIISPIAGKVYDKLGMKTLSIFGAVTMLASTFGMFLITLETPLPVAALLNAVRCIAIGCLMMPLVTWGVSGISKEHTAHGTALLTSLRTIAGAIGTAVFVGLMNSIAESSAETYGENAAIHGLNITFLIMSVFTIGLFCISIFGNSVKKTE